MIEIHLPATHPPLNNNTANHNKINFAECVMMKLKEEGEAYRLKC